MLIPELLWAFLRFRVRVCFCGFGFVPVCCGSGSGGKPSRGGGTCIVGNSSFNVGRGGSLAGSFSDLTLCFFLGTADFDCCGGRFRFADPLLFFALPIWLCLIRWNLVSFESFWQT